MKNRTLLAIAVLAVAAVSGAQEQTVIKAKGEMTIGKRAQTMTTSKQGSMVKVMVDSEPVAFPDQGPMMKENRVYVPLRGVFEKMGATVNWDRATNTVTAMRNGKKVMLPLDSTKAMVDGEQMMLDAPAMVMNGRALVPLRFLSESLGATVDWQASNMTVSIKSGAA